MGTELCRPQYDDNAVAVIITKQEKVQKYEKMISGVEVLESWFASLNRKCQEGTNYLQSAPEPDRTFGDGNDKFKEGVLNANKE